VTVTLCAPAAHVEATVNVTVALIPGVIDAGLIVAVTPVAAFTDRATAFFAAPLSVTPIVKVAVLPATTVPDVADCVNAKFKLGTAAAPQLFTSNAPSTDPNPVARLYGPPLAVNPVTPGTVLFPEGVAWNGVVPAFNIA
jgi:hypothetical protein